MILLHRLRADNFKQLSEVELHFPPSGTVLIEGNNEAGKSTLFEAAFFALYGHGLLPIPLADLRRYGTDAMQVELDFSIADRPFSLTRRYAQKHTARLVCPPGEDGEQETISSVAEIKRRLEQELRLSSDALLNTCFIEQKQLDKLEDLSAESRKTTINELLNLRVLSELAANYKIARDERDAVQQLRHRVSVARLDATLPELQGDVRQAEHCLHFVRLQHEAAQGAELEGEITGVQEHQDQVAAARGELAGSLETRHRLETRLHEVDGSLALRAHAWHDAALAHERVTSSVAELEALGATLPPREAQLQEWTALAERLNALETAEADAVRLEREHDARQQQLAAHDALQATHDAEQAQAQALDATLQERRATLAEATAHLQARQAQIQRGGRLALLLQHARTSLLADEAANALAQRLEAARADAERLPEAQARLEPLEAEEAHLGRRYDAQRQWQQAENDLNALQRRRAEAEAFALKLHDVGTRHTWAKQEAEAATQRAGRVGARTGGGIALAVLGVICIVAGFVTGMLPPLAGLGVLLLAAGIFLAASAGKVGASARTEHAAALASAESLESQHRTLTEQAGSHRPVEDSEIAAQTAERDRLRAERDAIEAEAAGDEPFDESRVHAVRQELQTVRNAVAASEAAVAQLPEMEAGHQAKKAQAEEEAGHVQALAQELGLSGGDAESWGMTALDEQESAIEEQAATPTAQLHIAVNEARSAATEIERQQAALESQQEARRRELEANPRPALLAALEEVERAFEATAATLDSLQDTRSQIEAAGLPPVPETLRTRLAVLGEKFEDDSARAAVLPAARQNLELHTGMLQEKSGQLHQAWQEVAQTEPTDTPEEALEALPAIRAMLEEQVAALDDEPLRAEDERLAAQATELARQMAQLTHRRDESRTRQMALRDALGVGADEPLESLSERFPELADADEGAPDEWELVLHECRNAVTENRGIRRSQAETLGLDDTLLDLGEAENALAEAERGLKVKARAGEIVAQTRQSIVGRVMPLTMQNMRLLLPQLTEGRYQDAQWDENSNYLSIYDSQARDFVRKRVFSGGARDQISLALRLAFALATLPGEHNVQPGWLFLDEPLSSFDRARTQALVTLLTRGLIRQRFSQIFLVSHNELFDPTLFDYRLRLHEGRITASTLPSG